MKAAAKIGSGKTHRDENFPVASRFVSAKHRGAILGFYRFARAADDIADHPGLAEAEKLKRLDDLEATLFGEADVPDAVPLRSILTQRRLSARHPCDLLAAFRRDVEKRRYADWDELMAYCEVSAMPVGRFVLDIHGEPQSTWGASDALCAALQIINHLQDCAKDYHAIDRVYLPADILATHGASAEDLAQPKASPQLREAIAACARLTAELLKASAPLSVQVRDRRLKLEIAAIQRLAEVLTERLLRRDPVSERVHLGKVEMAVVSGRAMLIAFRRDRRKKTKPRRAEREA